MSLDSLLAKRILDTQKQWLSEGRLLPVEKLRTYYQLFRSRFGPEVLQTLDGEALLGFMHDHGNRDGLVYWLEFKDDEEFPSIFGSIAGGSALKFGVYRAAETGLWMTRSEDNRNVPAPIEIEDAVAIARKHRAQLLSGIELLEALPENGVDADYTWLQQQMDDQAPDVSRLSWGRKYFSLLFPNKLDDYHAEVYQRFHLIKLLQSFPEGSGRYLVSGHFAAICNELSIPINHLTSVLNFHNGRPHRYWRVGTTVGENQDIWPAMRDGNFVAIGWHQIGNLSIRFSDHKELVETLKQELHETIYQTAPQVAGRKANEISRFANLPDYWAHLSEGDIVLAANGMTIRGIGRITGDYEYAPESKFPHRRPVEWLSHEQWKLPIQEGLQTSFVELKKHVINQIETERHILYADALSPTSKPARLQLAGVPGRIHSILERKGQVILYGPPGTGKTYWAEQTARILAAQNVYNSQYHDLTDKQKQCISGRTDSYVRMCSFHPSYGYEDFMEGYRPEVVNGQMTFTRREGIFRRLCEDARRQPQHNYYLIIDEINRGDIPRIFGELLTIMEKDKRGKSIVLPLSESLFSVPPNVFIIGTMNTADRSIALLDTALRRRFGFIELMPDYELLGDASVEAIPLGLWLTTLNQNIVDHVGRDARNLQVGHAYLLQAGKPITSFSRFARILAEDIIPLLEEYCYEDYASLEKILGRGIVDVSEQAIRRDLFSPRQKDALVQALLAQAPEITTSIQAAISEKAETEDEEDVDETGDGDE